MFVAKDIALNARVTSLDPEWGSRLEELRALAASGQLVCPGCEQLLRFRVGEQRRPHFAHRKVSECPLDRQSAEILEAKAKLYVWLCTKYPGNVEMDVNLQIPGWDRFADLVVRAPKGKTFAYWIFDRSPKNREELLDYHGKGFSKTILFTTRALNKEEDNSLSLTAAQRDFMVTSDFDLLRGSGHLHFLDATSGTLTIYRAFRCVCKPSLYEYNTIREAPLASALICPESGEIVFKEDVDEYLHQKELKKQSRVVATPVAPMIKIPAPFKEPPVAYEPQLRKPQVKPVAPPEPAWDGFYTCEMCGARTKETNYILSVKKTCICRACLPEYNAKRLRGLSHV